MVEARCLAGPPPTFAAYLPPARAAARLAATVRALVVRAIPVLSPALTSFETLASAVAISAAAFADVAAICALCAGKSLLKVASARLVVAVSLNEAPCPSSLPWGCCLGHHAFRSRRSRRAPRRPVLRSGAAPDSRVRSSSAGSPSRLSAAT